MAEERLRVLLDAIAKEKEYKEYTVEITPITSDGANYSSVLFHATISEPSHEDLHLFSKVINMNEEFRKMDDGIDTEFYFYTELNRTYEALQEKHRVPDEHKLIVPKFYKCNRKYLEEVLVLENLVKRGFTAYDRMKSMTWEYAAAAVSQLAKLHALSFAYKQENPEEFAEVAKRLPLYIDYEELYDLFAKTLKVSLDVVNEEHKRKVIAFFNAENRFVQYSKFWKMNDRDVLIHVDYKQSNLMHRRKNGKIQVVPVDFQTMCSGNPVADLLYFIFCGSDRQFRKIHYTNLIDYYYNELTAALRRLNIDVDHVYPKSEFKDDLKQMKFYGLIMSAILLPIGCVETENAPSLGEDANLNELTIVPSKELRRRMNDVVEEYIKLGLL